MARTKSSAAVIAELPLDKQIQVQGTRFIIETRANLGPVSASAEDQLTADFMRWMLKERTSQFQALLTDFALSRVEA